MTMVTFIRMIHLLLVFCSQRKAISIIQQQGIQPEDPNEIPGRKKVVKNVMEIENRVEKDLNTGEKMWRNFEICICASLVLSDNIPIFVLKI